MTAVELLDQIETFKDAHFIWFLAIMYATYLVNAALVLPLYALLSVVYAYVINDFVIGSLVLTFLPVLVSVTMYFGVSNTVIPYVRSKLQRFPVFTHLDHNMNSSSFTICLVIRFLYLPVGLKEYSILVLRYPFVASILSSIIYFGIHSIIFAGVGVQLHHANEIFKEKYWSDMSVNQKLDLALILISVTFTVTVFVYVTFWMRKKVLDDNNIDLSNVDDDDVLENNEEERERLVG